MSDRIISLDCESNGLHGRAFAAAAILVDEDGLIADTWTARCPIAGTVDPYVKSNVLPALANMPVTLPDYRGLLAAWRDWYAPHHDDALVVGHIVWPVEARFLSDAHAADPFSGPYPLLDVASTLDAHGHDPRSAEGYMRAHGLTLPAGDTHHPLFDAMCAASVYRHLRGAR